MPCVAILRILARVKDAGRTDKADHLSRRRTYVHRPEAPGRPTGTDHGVVRRILEVRWNALWDVCHRLGDKPIHLLCGAEPLNSRQLNCRIGDLFRTQVALAEAS